MSKELTWIVVVGGLDSLVALHLLVIGTFMGLMTHRSRYWRMSGMGMLLMTLPALALSFYWGQKRMDAGDSMVLPLLAAFLSVAGSAVAIWLIRSGRMPLGEKSEVRD